MRKDPRRWATFKVPDEARQTVQQAMWIAERMTASPVEAWESIAQEYLAANLPAFYEQCRRAKDEEAIFRLMVLCRDEWRCKMCGTSRNLQVHHIVTRQECHEEGREDLLTDPENGVALCARCHHEITKVHRDPAVQAELRRRIGL